MLSKEEYTFYNRHLLLENIGEAGQISLKKSKVLVVGAGGLGCPVLTYLTGAGVGHIGIVDGDTVNVANLHRQTLYGYKQLGLLKTDAAIERLKDLNPYVRFQGYNHNLTSANALIILNDYDVIVDATDNFPVRYLINDACVILDKPYVFASLDRFQGQLSVLNYRGGPTYRCIFPNPPDPQTAPGCSQVGVLGVVTGILGSLQANEVIKLITHNEHIMSGKILMVDVLKNQFYAIAVQKDKSSIDKVLDLRKGVADSEYIRFCDSSNNDVSVSVEEVKRKMDMQEQFQFVDIREKGGETSLENSIKIPVSQISQRIQTIDKDITLVLYCDKGVDSQKAAAEFKKHGLKNVYSLQGGLRAWQAYIKM
jgi:sulfur-carrier protein adenylyltransferase/sulfurtransferase